MSFQPQATGFHADGGADLFSTVLAYAKSLKEACSVMKNPATGRFHAIRQYDVSRRVKQLGWVAYATLTVEVSVALHIPEEQL